MSHGVSPLAAFHRTGDRSRLPEAAPAESLPALFAAYHDLAALRGDFPLLLAPRVGTEPWLQSLADAVDAALRETAPAGAGGEPVRRQVLSVEHAIRQQARDGHGGALDETWNAACQRLGLDGATPSLAGVRARLPANAELLDYHAEAAPLVLERAWREAEGAKAERMVERTQHLVQRLSDILLSDHARSAEARQAAALEKSVGRGDRSVFDFEAMAQILRSAPTGAPLPESRRQRIRSAIDILQQQRFVGGEAWTFTFPNCEAALAAFRQRLPALRDLVRAIAIAELELGNRYDEQRHDRFFETFDERRLGPGDLEEFPGYLLVLRDPDRAERDRALALLEAGIPFKIIIHITDILDVSLPSAGQPRLGRQAQNLARMAVGLDEVFVLQCTGALLYRLREAALRGMAAPQPALFSVHSGSDYLVTAAATEARAFPSFVYDPAAGQGQARRFSLAENPQPAATWTQHPLDFENAEHARQREDTAFTFADYVAADPRYDEHFVPLAEADAVVRDNELVPLADYLERNEPGRRHALPFVLLVDAQNHLHRAIVDERIVEATARCREAWRSLQELCGIDNSWAAAARAGAVPSPAAAEEPAVAGPGARADSGPSRPAAPPAIEEPPAAEPPEPAAASDDPWIETVRCTSCNECKQINDRMFAYDADQRAYIADPDAGSYRDLVEAAESCQVAIIHPGKPRNPDEPGLEDLLKRAEPFL